ncbi:MAG: cellulase family glycosylhydrolase [Planctomycetes bacterium]|nr:cellulase family glycosylhydrolase [Planctomycetota bacterium]
MNRILFWFLPIFLVLGFFLGNSRSGPRESAQDASKASPPSSNEMEPIQVAKDGHGFIGTPSGRRFTPWGLNYGHEGKLIEDFWEDHWSRVVQDFQDMKALGANVVRVHLQFGKFMEGPARPNPKALHRLGRLLRLAETTGLYLDLTGLGCYRKADIPSWYDRLSEEDRWSVQARFWSAVAARCGRSPAVFCYDLMNEPIVPGGQRKPGEWYSGKTLGGYDFVQFITLDPHGRPRDQIARQWIQRLTHAIREHDRRHLITVGLLPWIPQWGHLSGFVPETVGPELDFLSVHIYPNQGKVDEALMGLKKFAVGKPVVIEETFPLACSPTELEEFLKQSRGIACGWMGHYDGMTLQQLQALRKAQTITTGQAMYLGWLELFRRLEPK